MTSLGTSQRSSRRRPGLRSGASPLLRPPRACSPAETNGARLAATDAAAADGASDAAPRADAPLAHRRSLLEARRYFRVTTGLIGALVALLTMSSLVHEVSTPEAPELILPAAYTMTLPSSYQVPMARALGSRLGSWPRRATRRTRWGRPPHRMRGSAAQTDATAMPPMR